VHCATFYQSTLRHEKFEDVTTDVTPPSGRPFSRGFCSGLPVKRREEDRAGLSQFLLETSGGFINCEIFLSSLVEFLNEEKSALLKLVE